MFTRVLTRSLFFPRRQSHSSEGNAKQRKAGSSRSRSRSRSPESQRTQGVLQPSLGNVSTPDKQGTVPAPESKVVASKSSLKSLGSSAITDDENCPVQIQSESEREPAGISAYSGERSFGTDEQRYSLLEEDPREEYATPPLGGDLDTVQASSTFASLLSDVQTELPADRSVDSMPESHGAVASADEEIISLSSSQTSYGQPYPSLHTGLLSDITEADEPGTREASLGRSTEDLTTSGVAPAPDKGAISFSSFGSSYACTQSAETSMVLESESGSSLSTHLEEAVRDITADSFALSMSDGHGNTGSVQLHPTLLGSLPSSPAQTLRDSAVADETAVLTAAILAAQVPCSRGPASAPGTLSEDRNDATVVQAVDIPAPLTYADAMNLALQYPEMSSKILKEPLASTCSSACPTPARAVSPVRESTPASMGEATIPSSDSPSKSTSKDGRKQQGPAHTADRPNWALAPAEPRDARQSRSRGRGRGRSTGPAGARSGRGGQRSNWAPHPSSTSPATPPNRMNQPLPARPQSYPHVGPVVKEAVSARDLRKEASENWRDRVSSWREQASESSGQTTPDVQSAPTSSVGVSPALAQVPMTVPPHLPAIQPHSAAFKSPLNPNAPVWDYKSYRRERAATICQTRSMPSNAPSATPAAPIPHRQPVSDSDAQVEALRFMLHGCGVESKHTSMQLSAQARGLPSSSLGPPYNLRPVASFANFDRAPAAPHGVEMVQQPAARSSDFGPRQRTQTHHSLAHRASWQGEGIQAHIFPPQQPREMEGRPAPTANPAIWRPAVPSTGIQIAPPVAQVRPPTLAIGAERVVKALPSQGTAARSNYSIGPVTVQQASSSSQPDQPAPSNAQHLFNFARAGKHAGPVAPPVAPGSERTRPFSVDAGTIPPQKRARFTGIETPRVVYDSKGWTVHERL
ncbi:hypothetical protein FKP32DRAFT_1599257 [Trametes sanguinea]|nr:hypothetical protein FKP32DRAFT_1599257 [Trametes sanguinea]